MFRRPAGRLELLLAHPGGPFWSRRDLGAWTLPKGGIDPGEDPLAAAVREFIEETGFAPAPPYLPLGEIRQQAGKYVQGWAFEGDANPADLRSNPFEMEWPPRSGRRQAFAEIDRVRWFTPQEARLHLLPAQLPFVDRLEEVLAARQAAA